MLENFKKTFFSSGQKDNSSAQDVAEEDVFFVREFKNSGGKFLYCDDYDSFIHNLQQIITHEKLTDLVCFDTDLQQILTGIGNRFSESSYTQTSYALITCEHLIKSDGTILTSSHHTNNRRPEDLPSNVIIIAKSSQIVKNLDQALAEINAVKKINIPSNIMSIKAIESILPTNPKNAKNIYLLMYEY